MKSLQFTLYVSVPDDYDEDELAARVRDFTDSLHTVPRLEAKATFAYSGACGFDSVEDVEWTKTACDMAGKAEPADIFGDTRTPTR